MKRGESLCGGQLTKSALSYGESVRSSRSSGIAVVECSTTSTRIAQKILSFPLATISGQSSILPRSRWKSVGRWDALLCQAVDCASEFYPCACLRRFRVGNPLIDLPAFFCATRIS